MNLYDKMLLFYGECPSEWNYYGRMMSNPFDSLQVNDFIRQYFVYGGKEMVIVPYVDEVDPMRNRHTVSTFFLGLLIKQKLCPDLEIRCLQYEDYKFSYLWFLVCLFHDIGYLQENDWTYKYEYGEKTKEYLRTYKAVKGDRSLRYAHEDLGLLYVAPSIYKSRHFSKVDKLVNVDSNQGIEFNNGIRVGRAMYHRDTIMRYLEYCKMNLNIKHYDHGIVGGLWLYDSLMKNYNMQYHKVKLQNREAVFEDFMVDGWLHFTKEQSKVFAYLADCIISHNMWPANEQTNEMYKKCGLDELTMEEFQRIRFCDNPILFILALADTVEPIKTYADCLCSQKEIWSGIDIEFEPDCMVVKLLDDRLPFERLANKILGLDNWLAVRVLVDTGCREIEIQY